jgi:hypothetical protein
MRQVIHIRHLLEVRDRRVLDDVGVDAAAIGRAAADVLIPAPLTEHRALEDAITEMIERLEHGDERDERDERDEGE